MNLFFWVVDISLKHLGLMLLSHCQVGLYQQYGQPADECDVPFHEQQTAFCPQLGPNFSKDLLEA